MNCASVRGMSSIEEFAPAKVNLTLSILDHRPDGYHEIDSLIAFASRVGDTVRLELGKDRAVRVIGPFAQAITGENLVTRALSLLADTDPRLALSTVTLQKSLPVAAGLGGGSTDAAAVLRAVRKANPDLAVSVDWRALAIRLGADVPVCLDNTPAFATGAGEAVASCPDFPELPVVLANAMVPAPADKTAQVFRAHAALNLDFNTMSRGARPSVRSVEALLAYMQLAPNDLETAARSVMPWIGTVMSALLAAEGCVVARMSGAGPTCFGVFRTRDDASAAARALKARNPTWWVEATELG